MTLQKALREKNFAGGGKMGALMRAFDWSATPIGLVETWPQSLRSVLKILLASRSPMQILWGSDYVQFYNDAYIPLIGTQHPQALGQSGTNWQVGPLLEQAIATGEATETTQQLILNRNGNLEECYFTFSYTPIRDESGAVGGILVTANETTQHVLSEHRQNVLRGEAQAAKKSLDILANMSDAFVMLDREGRYTYVNDKAAQLLGIPEETLLGQSIWNSFLEIVGEHLKTELHRAIAAQTVTCFEYFCRRTRGWFECRAYPLDDGALLLCVDITERKRLEEKLRRREREFSTLVENSPDVIFRLDRHLRHLYINSVVEKASGIPPEQFIGKTGREVGLPEDECDRFESICQTAIATGAETQIEFCFHTRQFRSRIIPEFAPDGSVESLMGLTEDITERKGMEQALRESEERYRSLVIVASSIVWIAESGGAIKSTLGWQEFTGQTPEQYRGWGWIAALHPEDCQTTAETWRQALRNKTDCEVEYRLRHRDGQYHYVSVRGVPILDRTGNIREWIGTTTDITERKRTETAQRLLAEISSVLVSSLDYQTTLTSIAHLVVPTLADFCFFDLVTSDQKIQRVAWKHKDPTKQAWFDQIQHYVPAQDFKNHPVAEVFTSGKARIVPEVDNEWLQSIAINAEHLQFIQECQLHSLITVPLIARDRKLGALTLCLMRDSKRHYTHADLILAAELAHRAALALDNAQLYHQAQEANRIKDEFLAVLSHELRTPLNPILGWATLLQSSQFDPETMNRGLEIIERNAKLQTQLIEDLLDVSRILRGKLSLNVLEVNPAYIITAALETVRLTAQAKSIEIQTTLDPDVGQVTGDPDRLQQVVWNLLSNAIKFTSSGGRVEIHLIRVERHAQIQVKDTGIGIKPEFLPHVFEYFRQADGSTTRSYGGLGLGLAIVHNLVELHGGTVQVDSLGQGKGATFTVKLPLSLKPEARTPTTQLAQKRSFLLEGLKILVVDDEADMQELLTFVLEKFGATVISVSSAAEALAVLSHSLVDLLISDIGMPRQDGYWLMRQVRARSPQQGGQIQAIALTAYAGEINQQKAIAAGFQTHLAKPITPDALAAAITSLLIRGA